MISLPWRHVASWNCTACGLCCRGFRVTIGFDEWMKIVGAYGVGATEPGLDKFYLRRRRNGTCIFLHKLNHLGVCGLQHMKPRSCKLWPFKVLDRPKYGRPDEASYTHKDKEFFIYVDPSCIGIKWGRPTARFTYTLTELVQIALGTREKQYYSTSGILHHRRHFKIIGRTII